MFASRISLDKKGESGSRNGIGVARQREYTVESHSVSQISGITLPLSHKFQIFVVGAQVCSASNQCNRALRTWIPNAVVLCAFSAYTVVAGQPLTVSKAFVSIEIFSQLQGPMADLPNQIFALLHAYVSMQRVQAYLEEDEVEDWASSIKLDQGSNKPEPTPNSDVGFHDAAFRWHVSADSRDAPSTAPPEGPTDEGIRKPSRSFLLGHLNIEFPTGRLSLITGPTGSGKSSLLAALLGEMDCVSGNVRIDKSNHSVAYAGQFPFLEHATIRDNILYHTPFDSARYDAVLWACALLPDLAILDAGDLTGKDGKFGCCIGSPTIFRDWGKGRIIVG